MDAVRVLVDEGPWRVEELIRIGAVFDYEKGGGLARAREGGHSVARVLHAGGAATGAEVERALVEAVRWSATAIYEGWFALDLLVAGKRCVGVSALDERGAFKQVYADQVIVAAGGAGQMFAVTTNPVEATGDGIAMALRAGVPVARAWGSVVGCQRRAVRRRVGA
jgi:L-aspartate oxidase